MPQVSFDDETVSPAVANDHDADVGGSCQDSSRPLVVRREALADPVVPVVRLADLQHVQRLWPHFLADGVNARKRLKELAERMHFEATRNAALAPEGD